MALTVVERGVQEADAVADVAARDAAALPAPLAQLLATVAREHGGLPRRMDSGAWELWDGRGRLELALVAPTPPQAAEVASPWLPGALRPGCGADDRWIATLAHALLQAVALRAGRGRAWLVVSDAAGAPIAEKVEAGLVLARHAAVRQALEGFERIHLLDQRTLWTFAPGSFGLRTLRPPPVACGRTAR